jgi:hypothetical protein
LVVSFDVIIILKVPFCRSGVDKITVGDIDTALPFDFIVTDDAYVSGVSGCLGLVTDLGERPMGGIMGAIPCSI